MKKITTIVTFALVATVSIILYSCRKSKDIETETTKKKPFNLMPVSNPVFPNIDKINDHLRHLAFGTASLFDLIYLSSPTPSDYVSEIERLIKHEEVPFERINTYIDINYFKDYSTNFSPKQYNNAIYDAINWSNTSYGIYQPRANIWTGYDDLALQGFIFNTADYFTLLRIPEWDDLQNDPSRLLKPVVVVPNEEDINGDLILPIIGFTYDPINDIVNMVQWNTEEDFDDEVNYYVWVVDYAPTPIAAGTPLNNCTGDNAPIGNDGYCDMDCEENFANSPNDCNPAFLKKVWIEDLEIIEDYKQKCGTNYQWQESRLHGRYEIAYQCVVAHSNGKVKARGGLLHERWSRSQVRTTKKIGWRCNFNSKGTGTYKTNVTPWMRWKDNQFVNPLIEDNKALQPRAYLSENYKPWRDTIYLLIYEYDKPQPGRDRNINVFYRPGRFYTLEYTTRNNEGPFGDKTNTNGTVAFNSLNPANGLSVPNAQVVMITPFSWPGFGVAGVTTDQFTINGIGSSNGANASTYSLKVKLKYGP